MTKYTLEVIALLDVLNISGGKGERERTPKAFFKNQYQFTKGFFSQSKSGKLQVSGEVLEENLKKTYSDESRARVNFYTCFHR